MIDRFRKVCNNVYRGSAPSKVDVVYLKKNFKINKIISLDRKCGNEIHKVCKLLNIEHHIIHLDDSKKSILNLLRHPIKNLILDNAPTYIHCKHGKDRTGFVCALFKIQYMNMNPKDALNEAKSLDFGIPKHKADKGFYRMIDLYTKLILSNDDINQTDDSIVDVSREMMFDNMNMNHSFAPYLTETREYPYDNVYNSVYDQSPTRQNYDEKPIINPDNNQVVPQIGVYNNMSGMKGLGPVENVGGYFDQ